MLFWVATGVNAVVSFVGWISLASVFIVISAMYSGILAVDAIHGAVTLLGHFYRYLVCECSPLYANCL